MKGKSRVPILLYHDLDSPEFPTEKTHPATVGTVVQRDLFEAHMGCLASNGYKTLSLSQLLGRLKTGASASSKEIVLTFDDGHRSNAELAYPVLKRYGFTATFFIVAGRMGDPYHLDEDRILELAQGGMEIGSHGLTHEYLVGMDREEIRYELEESKRRIEAVAGRAVEHFAFPGGHYNGDVLRTLPLCGYRSACSCLQGLNGEGTSPYLLRRIEIRRGLTADQFAKALDPLHVLFYAWVDLFKAVARKSAGLSAYSEMREKLYKYYVFKR